MVNSRAPESSSCLSHSGSATAASQISFQAASNSDGRGGLSRRETDVARLMTEGLSNKQIGTRLFISERTVESHVRNILTKLGFTSRAQVADWMVARNR